MRHWITSFRIVAGTMNLERSRDLRKCEEKRADSLLMAL
jgi:hypothetical protein